MFYSVLTVLSSWILQGMTTSKSRSVLVHGTCVVNLKSGNAYTHWSPRAEPEIWNLLHMLHLLTDCCFANTCKRFRNSANLFKMAILMYTASSCIKLNGTILDSTTIITCNHPVFVITPHH
jgi:hypothetical protein